MDARIEVPEGGVLPADGVQPGDGGEEAAEVCIVGTGFAGMGAAIRLKQAGIGPVVLLEAAGDVGGTWRDNTYPGCACDIPSHLYSFSFAPKADWTRMYPPQAEIQDYMRDVARRFGLLPHIRFHAAVTACAYDAAAALWRVRCADGRRVAARFLILGLGGLSRPALPDIPGRGSFQGRAFHSQQWDHGYDLTGKRVAVIGTGASAIQFVPRIAPQVARLHLFQRTPPWIMPRPDRPIGPWERAVYRHVPGAAWLRRASIYWWQESLAVGFTLYPGLLRRSEQKAKDHIAAQIPDPELRRKVTPDFHIGCKRVLISDDYYPALTRPTVELVTDPVREITSTGIVTADGVERAVDCIVYGTGFRATDYLAPLRVVGPDGVDLNERWRDGAEAHLGTTVAGYPNLFLMTGPNTGLGHNSIVFMIEAQLNLVMDLLCRVRDSGARTVEPRAEVQRRFNEAVQERMRRTVWMSGCRSWYLDARGRNTTLWPGFTVEYWRRTRRAVPGDYLLDAPHPVPAVAADTTAVGGRADDAGRADRSESLIY
ncbi:flavin-containing monooxygenase [Rhodospirillum centenum]|uniref:FAD-binding monooxygenase, putative n=1 Tax=Rhodospirillum centenum (strain ATCC 51521 / SW) TaxID=414684 RepID=B6IUF7_RHOCS|nr:NAD(P)/FAD-dependent oxidoreductase [Rhodospirillum centenum]ACI99782.1 FAD-binding monooxygenase, putative [Rhodospirillum centenum SW]